MIVNPYALLIPAVVLLPVASFVSFELLLYRMHDAHQLEWLRTGSPRLLFESTNSGTIARWRFGRTLLFSTPSWVKKDKWARLYLLSYRVTVGCSVVGFFGLPLVALLLS